MAERPVRSAVAEVVCDEETELAISLAEHVHGHSDVARVETMTRTGTFKSQFLLKRHVP